jgi:hypothetical protein
MKTILSLFLFCISFIFAAAQTDVSPSTENSKIEVKPLQKVDESLGLKENEYNFGKIPQGKPVSHIFEVTNLGKDSLKIENVQASCGCTTPEWEHDAVEASGQKTNIKVGFNAASEGAFTKIITITYNGTQSKQITIKGEVWKTPTNSAPENKSLNNLKEE